MLDQVFTTEEYIIIHNHDYVSIYIYVYVSFYVYYLFKVLDQVFTTEEYIEEEMEKQAKLNIDIP